MLVIGFYFFVLAFISRIKHVLSAFLFSLFSASFFCAWLIGKELLVYNWNDALNLIFTILALTIIGFSFYPLKRHSIFKFENSRFFKFSGLFITIFLIPALLINIFIVASSFEYVINGNVSVTKFKNQGEAYSLIRRWVPASFVFYVNLFSGMGLIALAYHFYFISKKKINLSILFFLISLNIPLVGLHALSRATVVQFILMYACLYMYVYPTLDRTVRRKFNLIFAFSGFFISIVFLFVTYYRFSDSGYYLIPDESLIKNITTYSIFDYFTQWINNGIVVLNNFTLGDLWYGKSSISLVDYILEKIGFPVQSYVDVRNDTLGLYSSRFNGLVATLVYDFSHIGVLAFILLFCLIVKLIASRGAVLNGYSLPFVGFVFSVPGLFFSNNFLSNEIFSLSGFYALVFLCISKLKFHIGSGLK